jgi:HprK-related kinase B
MANESISAALFHREVAPPGSLRFRLGLLLHGCRIEIRTGSRALAEKLAYYYKGQMWNGSLFDMCIDVVDGPALTPPCDFRPVEPAPGKKLKEELCDVADGRFVRKSRTGMLFAFGDDFAVACGPSLKNEPQVVNFINARFMAWLACQGYMVFHAAGVAAGGRGLALAGRSGMGKSSLALRMLSRGANFVSNDRLLLRRTGPCLEMVGVPKMPRINPGTLVSNPQLHSLATYERREAYRAIPPEELWNLEEKYDAMIDECYGAGRQSPSAEAVGLVILNWRRSDDPLQISRTDFRQREELLPTFQKQLGVFAGAEVDRLAAAAPKYEDYCRTLADCPLFEVQGGVDFDRAAEACMNYLVSGSMPGVS